MSSIRKVAELAGVSLGSVSRYLNGHQLKEQNMKKIAAAIKELDYKENIIAKGLKNNRSFSVGLLMNSVSSQFGAEIVSAIEGVMEQNGYSVLLSGFKGDVSLADQKIDYLVQHAVDGLIVFMSEQDWDGMERLAELPIPVLTINSPIQLPGVDRIQVADRKSVAKVTEHLIKEGHTRIGLLAAPQNDYVARERLLGAQQTAAKHSGTVLVTEYGDYSRISGYRGGKKLLEQDITALIVTNYNMMTGVLEYLQHSPDSTRKNLVLAHYDYTSEMAELLTDRIVIKAPTQLIGQRSAQRLLERLNPEVLTAGEDETIDNEIFGI
ncbi:LacI family DNA-binding transcriptional regulator [Candidatus Enterococcus murrayae]|uniref:LacI family DNA-binding transcriptional regulator n=1 Tax=Candidatus Enterococcus murrayae TaxID=2815321 RepID=A0ABS3HGZ1_9ENTE|nr:LacI family DNA-binding transcriptional regulator [Enterococcus sp. MJM16]MBO0452689.1 LacI family DNA-binding transcriptional regulator [Enterococcus sp. MJM16]